MSTKPSDALTEKTEPQTTITAKPAIESDPQHYPPPAKGFVELDGIRAALVRPTYGNMQTLPENSLLSAVMTASNHGARWCGNFSPDKLGWGHARNFATTGFFNVKEGDGIVWIDSDIVMPTWAIWKLLSNAKLGYDFVSGVYFNRGNPFAPVIYEYRPSVDGYANVQSFPPNEMWKIDGCGFGFCWTSRRMIEAMHDMPEFDEKTQWFPDTRWQEGGAGEDFNFCKAATRAGFDIWADTSILLGHEGEPKIYTIEDHIKLYE